MKKVFCLVLCFLMIFSVLRVAINQASNSKEFEYIKRFEDRMKQYTENAQDALSLQEMLNILSQYEFMTVNSLNAFIELYDYIALDLEYLKNNSKNIFDAIINYIVLVVENSVPLWKELINNTTGATGSVFIYIIEFAWSLVWDACSLLVISFRLVHDLLGLRRVSA